jgi:NADPH-dependent 2,4-dienoyl-CoA reductase/sulfur reductase-like enzyme
MPSGDAGEYVKRCQVLIAGAGPAGMAAAIRAREGGKSVTVLDDNPAEGGQIWRGAQEHPPTVQAARWLQRFRGSGAELIPGARVVSGDAVGRTLLVECHDRSFEIRYDHLIIASGARELFLPFPGWTLPGITGVGGLQAMVKSGLPVERKRIVVAGTGPLLLAVASYLRKRGAIVVAVVEQTEWSRLLRFAVQLRRYPAKLKQAATLTPAAYLTGTYLTGAWVVAAEGHKKVQRVTLNHLSDVRTVDCDYLAAAYGFQPNVELARYLGCELQDHAVKVDDLQQSSVSGISCAGEITGIGGVDQALIEGEIAGCAVAGLESSAQALFPVLGRARAFGRAIDETFALRSELRSLAAPDTIVCRCEDVTMDRLRTAGSWRAAKLHLRCGMGPCQGRICGPATQFLFGWQVESIRPPVFPARVASLISETDSSEKGMPV